MGIELVKTIAGRHGRLSGNQYKVLVYMAAMALDRPNDRGQPPRLYFGGWEPLALALGKDVPAPGRESERDRRAQYELVRRALQGLERAGLIERLEDHPQKGARQTFRLVLSPYETAGQEPLRNSGAQPPQNVGVQPLRNVGDSPYETAGPRKSEEEAGLTAGLITHHQAPLTSAACDVCGHDRFAEDECLRCHTSRAVA